jgi:RNA polymerase sigma factor (sigma-70 family)
MSIGPPFANLMTSLARGDDEAAAVVWERFAQRLTALAAKRLPGLLQAKTDPESVVLSVFQCFFARHKNAQFTLANWDSLWTLLTVLTVRKCGHRVRHFRAACRDIRREEGAVARETSGPGWEALEPTPPEALLLTETLDEVLQSLKPDQRAVLQLRLEGYTIEEISRQVGCTERTVHRVLEKVRGRLETDAAQGDAT